MSFEVEPIDNVVLDTAAFIKNVDLSKIGKKLFTISEVIAEIRDAKTREKISYGLLDNITIRAPHPMAVKADFSKKTGDYSSLSLTDIKVIALAYTLERETHNGDISHLRSDPHTEKPQASTKSQYRNFFNPQAAVKTVANQNGENKDSEKNTEKGAKDSSSAVEIPLGVGDFGEEDDEEGWITPENVKEYTAMYSNVDLTDIPREQVLVGCITTDFAMQNVLLQIGMYVIAADGMLIRTTQKWILRCYACYKLCEENDKQFCPFCGGHTLEKVSYTVDGDGNREYRIRKFKNGRNLRGTKFPIPMPKSGRHANNLIVSAAQLPSRSKKEIDIMKSLDDIDNNIYDDGFITSNSRRKGGPQVHTATVGYGKKNPNQARKKFGKKNKSKRS